MTLVDRDASEPGVVVRLSSVLKFGAESRLLRLLFEGEMPHGMMKWQLSPCPWYRQVPRIYSRGKDRH